MSYVPELDSTPPYTSKELFGVNIDNLFRYLFKIALHRHTTDEEKAAYNMFTPLKI